MNVILGALVRRIKQRAYLDSDEEIARWIEEYCEQSNSHKHSVMQGLPYENIADLYNELSGSPTVGNSAAGQSGSDGKCPKCSDYGIIQDEHGRNSNCECHY